MRVQAPRTHDRCCRAPLRGSNHRGCHPRCLHHPLRVSRLQAAHPVRCNDIHSYDRTRVHARPLVHAPRMHTYAIARAAWKPGCTFTSASIARTRAPAHAHALLTRGCRRADVASGTPAARIRPPAQPRRPRYKVVAAKERARSLARAAEQETERCARWCAAPSRSTTQPARTLLGVVVLPCRYVYTPPKIRAGSTPPSLLRSTIFQCSAVARSLEVVASFFAMARLLGSARARASPLALQWRRATSTTCQGADPHPRILHAAPDWLVIDKPAGWHSVRPGGARQRRGTQGAGAPLAGDAPAGAAADDALGAQRCVQDWLAETVPGQQRLDEAGLCNRLDLVTSGCMLAAKTAESLELLRAGVRSGDGVAKHYLALICGTLQPQEGSFSLYFSGRYRRSKKVSVSPHRPAAGDRHHGDPCCLPSPVSPFLLLSRARTLSLCMSNTPLVLSCPEQEPADGAYWVRGPSLSPRPTCSE